MSSEFAIAEVLPGKLNALVKNLMHGMDISDPNEAVRRVNSKEWVVVQSDRRWREQDSVIYFSVTSDGTTGSQWITRLEGRGFRVNDYAKSVLRSSAFKSTEGVTYEVAVLKGMLFEDGDRITEKIRAEADHQNLAKPNAEVACLIRETFSDKEIEAMGLWWIVVMHEPIKASDGNRNLLSANRVVAGCWLNACDGYPGHRWYREYGFAFVALQVSSEN